MVQFIYLACVVAGFRIVALRQALKLQNILEISFLNLTISCSMFMSEKSLKVKGRSTVAMNKAMLSIY